MCQQFINEVGKFINFQCPVSTGYIIPQIIEIGRYFTDVFKKRKGAVCETQCSLIKF